MSRFSSDPSSAGEIGVIAHGPAVLAHTEGVTLTLRSITAYSHGLEVSTVVVARGIHADALRRQYTAPAVIDPATGRRRPGPIYGRPMTLRSLDDSILEPTMRSDSHGSGNDHSLCQREYVHAISGLPHTRHLVLIAEWLEVGLGPASIDLLLPDPAELAASIITST